jgi:hypothetical protein
LVINANPRNLELEMKKLMILVAALSLVAAASGTAMAFTHADEVISLNPTPAGAPNYAPSMNMNWLNNPDGSVAPVPPDPDRLLGAYDQYAVGWGPAAGPWTGTANAIVHMESTFTNDGVVAVGPVNYDVTDEAVLSQMGYDLVIYGLGYGFDAPFESHGQVKVYVAEELSGPWTLVSGWTGEPNGTNGIDYFENQDGTLYNGVQFNNGGFSAWSYTFMTIDLDNLKIIDPATGELMDLDPATGEYNYVWFESGYYEDDGMTHGNASFLDAFGANPVPEVVATPTFAPDPGIYTSAQNVTISCATEGATIYYTINGAEPTETSIEYSGPVAINATTNLKAKAFKTNWDPSDTASGAYTITGTVATPTFSPPSGTYATAQEVTISCATEGATIYYTINGAEPTETSIEYSGPVAINATTNLKAKAFKDGWESSQTASGLYTITGTAATPTLSPDSGTQFTSSLDITINCETEDATIYYTTDSADPTQSSFEYTGAITITETTTFKAKAFREGWIPSVVATATYTRGVAETVATPTFSPPSGTYATAQEVTISCGTEGASIYYTINGAEPTETSIEYSGPVAISTSTILKARAFKTGWSPSQIASGIYAIAGFIYADNVVVMDPTPAGIPNHAPSMNMNWLNDPATGAPSPDPNPNPDRLLGGYDQYAIGWGPAGPNWAGTSNAIVRMAQPFTHDGVVAAAPVNYDVTDAAVLSQMGYDLVIYGLGYGFDAPFESHGQVKVYVADQLYEDINDWTLVSSWSGDPNGTAGVDYFENQDGTLYNGVPFNNGGFSAWSYTFMTIDLDNPKIIDPATGELKDLDPITGEYNYIWFEAGYYEDDGSTHGNASFLDAFAAYSLHTEPEEPEENHPPVADAGADQTVYPDDTVTLDALGTSDTDGDKLLWEWRQISGTDVTLSNGGTVWTAVDRATFEEARGSEIGDPNWNPDADEDGNGVVGPEDYELILERVNPTFTAPHVGIEGEVLEFELSVSDGEYSDTDTVSVEIRYNIVAVPGFAVSVEDQQGCVSRNLGVADEGIHALGLPDYESGGDCSGWTERSTGYLTLAFDLPVADGEGDDLTIYYSGQGTAQVSFSRDGGIWTYPLPLPDAAEGDDTVHQASYDLGEFGLTSAHYVTIEKTGTAGGIFIDALEGRYVGAVAVYATSVSDQQACVWSIDFDNLDGGEHALGTPDFETGGGSGWTDMDVAGYLILAFDVPLADGRGDDLTIYHTGWAEVSAALSEDGVNWTGLGNLPEGAAAVQQTSYDFSGLGVTSARYIKINKEPSTEAGPRFIDAVKGHYGISEYVDPAGKDQSVKEGTSVTLGAGSNPLSAVYEWVQVDDGSPLVIFSADSAPNPTFVAPSVPPGAEIVLVFQLYMDANDYPFETTVTVVDNGITDISSDAQFTFNNPVSDNNMGMSCDGGDITGYAVLDPDSSYSVDMTEGPEDLIYGLISFQAQVNAGATVVVTIYLPEPAPAGYKWYKYNDTDGWFDFSRDAISAGSGDGAECNDDRTQVTLYITDNGDYDDNGTLGIIGDPSGLGQPGGSESQGGDGSAVTAGGGGSGGCFIGICASESSFKPTNWIDCN